MEERFKIPDHFLKNLLTGRTTEHLVSFQETKSLVHKDMASSLSQLFKAAQADGLDLQIASSFRPYDRQELIWNEKAKGLRPALDSGGLPLDVSKCSEEELLFELLHWSALPGTSRHHWGTDFDYFDQSGIGPEYRVQLMQDEYAVGGVFGRANEWLSQNMGSFGFFRPFTEGKGRVSPEPWHLSYKPLADRLLENFTFEVFLEHLERSTFALQPMALNHADLIYRDYVAPYESESDDSEGSRNF